MAKLKITIPIDTKNPRSYIPRELINEGFTGEVEILADAFTATLLKPGVPLEQIKRSLQLVLEDVNLRIEQETNSIGEIEDGADAEAAESSKK
jgi:hypothetical protein